MKAVLLGPNGQLGHDLRRVYEARGKPFDINPVGRDRLDLSRPESVPVALNEIDFDILVNCTGYHRTDEAEDNAPLAFAVNAHAVEALAALCASRKARFIHISTDYVFGGDKDIRDPIGEETPVAPVNVYGQSKAMGESLALTACEDTVILRVASLYGIAGSSGKGGNFVETMIRLGREKRHLSVVNDQVMSPTSTADVARILFGMMKEGCDSGLYHVVGSGTATWFEFARDILRLANVAAFIEPCTSAAYPTRAARPSYSALDNARVSAAFGPIPHWRDSLALYLREKGYSTGTDNAGGIPGSGMRTE